MAAPAPLQVIALDGTPLITLTGGIRRYTLALSTALAGLAPATQIVLLSDQVFAAPSGLPENIRSLPGPPLPSEGRWWWSGLSAALRRCHAQVFHGTDFSVPYRRRLPSVMTVHDISPWINAAWNRASRRVKRRTPWLLRFQRADRIITPSTAVARQVSALFGVRSDRIRTTPLAASAAFQPVGRPAPSVPYFLFVGTLEARKNLKLLLEAWRTVRKQCLVDLVLCGRLGEGELAPPAEPGLRWTGPVPDEDLPALYSGAVACLYPSFYEGFGLPILEAMQCGAPVATSLDPAIEEVAGDAAVRLDATNVTEWVEVMHNFLKNQELCAKYRASGLRRAALFSWERTARATWQIYEEAQKEFGR